MKMVSRAIILSLVIGLTSMMAQVNSNYDGPKPEVHSGAKSLVFQYTPFQSNLEPVYVGTVSAVNIFTENFGSADLFGAGFRYFVTDQIALGIGLSVVSTTSTTEDDIAKTESSTTFFGIGIDANYHLKTLYSVSPYVGLNINYGLFSGSNEYTPDGGDTETTDYSGSGFGAAAQFGFDWYFTEGLSLGGKYAFGFRSLGEPEISSEGETEKGSSSTTFGISTFSVTLNVHI